MKPKFQVFKCKYQIYQRIELKEQIRKITSFVQLCLLPNLWSLEHENGSFYVISPEYRRNRPSLGKIFKCTWKVLFCSYTKYYGLWSSELLLASFQHLKIQDLTSPLLTQSFFFISTQNISRTVTSKAYLNVPNRPSMSLLVFACSKSTTETLEKGVKYVQS